MAAPDIPVTRRTEKAASLPNHNSMGRPPRWGLFGRTFLLLAALMIASLAVWLQAFRNMELEPRAQQMAQQIVTTVNITRAALVYSAPIRRRFLLLDLATNEGIQIYPRDDGDRVEPLPNNPFLHRVARELERQLGPQTQIMWAVNDIPGLWVSFAIEGDKYWAVLARDRAERPAGVQWVGWGLAALLLSLSGAAVIVGFVNRPLSRLARAAQTLSRGETPTPLPEERGPREIRAVNASFNRMVAELDRAEADRALMLAGISHDLRTPLARIRLEVEMSPMSEAARAGIEHDLSQIEHTIDQFMEYARPSTVAHRPIDVSQVMTELVLREEGYTQAHGGTLRWEIAPGLKARVLPSNLQRAASNLIENARKYGRSLDGALEIAVRVYPVGHVIHIDVCDKGPGISEEERLRLVRPFVRGAHARTGAGGAGLGMAIVRRLLAPAGGTLSLHNLPQGGLCARMTLPRSDK